MTREEEIENEAHRVSYNGDEFSSFIQGAEWADEHPNGSIIKWQTGEPKEKGMYLVTTKDGLIRTAQFMIEYGIKTWAFGLEVIAWCPLRDIEPYKEETK